MADATVPQDPAFEEKGKGKAVAEDVPQDDAMVDDDDEDSSSDEEEEVSLPSTTVLSLGDIHLKAHFTH